jgi:hypothetical protein
VSWTILWPNCFGNVPIALPAGARYAARVAITLALGVGTWS